MVIVQEQLKFQHRVSRGSRYNQIYIPKEMESIFGVGDMVEVRLLSQSSSLKYNGRFNLGEFKQDIIKQIFSVLKRIRDIEQIIIFGSFLTEEIDYHDIDIAILTNKENLEEKAYSELIKKLPLKFHVISFKLKKLNELLEFCPITRSMFYYSVSNKNIFIPKKSILKKEHIQFLLMMPQDLLKIKILNSRAYFDSLRRLITIIQFLKNESLDPLKINLELKKLIGELYFSIKNNESLNEENYFFLKKIISQKIKEINLLI